MIRDLGINCIETEWQPSDQPSDGHLQRQEIISLNVGLYSQVSPEQQISAVGGQEEGVGHAGRAGAEGSWLEKPTKAQHRAHLLHVVSDWLLLLLSVACLTGFCNPAAFILQ